MAQITALTVYGIPGQIHSFSAKSSVVCSLGEHLRAADFNLPVIEVIAVNLPVIEIIAIEQPEMEAAKEL